MVKKWMGMLAIILCFILEGSGWGQAVAEPKLAPFDPSRGIFAVVREGNAHNDQLVIYDMALHRTYPITSFSKDGNVPILWSPYGSWLLYLQGNDLFLYHYLSRRSIQVIVPPIQLESPRFWKFSFLPDEKGLAIGTSHSVFFLRLGNGTALMPKVMASMQSHVITSMVWQLPKTLFIIGVSKNSEEEKHLWVHLDDQKTSEKTFTRPKERIAVRLTGEFIYEVSQAGERQFVAYSKEGKSEIVMNGQELGNGYLEKYLARKNYFFWQAYDSETTELTLYRPGKRPTSWLKKFRFFNIQDASPDEKWIAITSRKHLLREKPGGDINLVHIDSQQARLVLKENRRYSYSFLLIRPQTLKKKK